MLNDYQQAIGSITVNLFLRLRYKSVPLVIDIHRATKITYDM